jgi:hypothetical protein
MKVYPAGITPSDLQFYQMGWLDIATEGAPNDYIDALELHVTYHVRFMKPRVEPSVGSAFMMDLDGRTIGQPMKPIANTPAVKQPRVNTLGLALSSTNTTLAFPLRTPVNTVYMVTWVNTSPDGTASTANITPLSVTPSGGLVSKDVLSDQADSYSLAPSALVNTGSNSAMTVYFVSYDGTGSLDDPPTLTFAYAGGGLTYPTLARGTIIVTQISAAMASGYTSRVAARYTRQSFFIYLCDVIAGRSSKHAPPSGLGRLTDWAHQFTKSEGWNVDTKLPSSGSTFDMTFSEALSAISRYVDPSSVFEVKESDPCHDYEDVVTRSVSRR